MAHSTKVVGTIRDIEDSAEVEKEFLKRQKKSPDISICCLLSREQLVPWCFYQIEKQRSYLKKKGITSEVLIITDCNLPIKNDYKKINAGSANLIGSLRNKVCNEARGKYIAFIDDDDWYPEYRIHLQYVCLEFYNKDINIATVDEYLCYDFKETFVVRRASESCLFFRTKYYKKSLGFLNSNLNSNLNSIGEGQSFCSGQKVYMENQIDMIVALRHGDNSSTINEKEVLCEGLHPELKFDKYELNFLRNKFFNDIK